MKAGDTVKWIAPTAYVGPGRINIAVAEGEQRKVVSVSADGTLISLEGRNGQGWFGMTSIHNVEMVTAA